MKKNNKKWIITITIMAFAISMLFSFLSETILKDASLILGIILVLIFILLYFNMFYIKIYIPIAWKIVKSIFSILF